MISSKYSIAMAAVLFAAAFAGVMLVADVDADEGATATSITYKIEGGDSATRVIGEATTFIAPAPAELGLDISGKDFLNWKNGSAVFKAGQEYLISALTVDDNTTNATLVAVFDENVYITLVVGEQSFKCPTVASGTSGDSSATYKIDASSTQYKAAMNAVDAIDTDKFEVKGFFAKDATSETNLDEFTTSVSVVLTEKIVPVYKISFIADGVTIKSTSTKNASVSAPEDPEKANYKFDGWFDENGVEFDSEYVFTADTVFTAKFIPNTYKVYFMNGDEVFAERSSEYMGQIDLPALPEGCKAWADKDGHVVKSPVTITGEMTFYAVADVIYKVVFMNGEDKVAEIEVLEGTVISADQIPAVPEGCSGWDADLSAPVVADMTVNAKPIVYFTVVFDYEDKNLPDLGLVIVKVAEGAVIPAEDIPAPVKDKKWNFDASAPVVADMKVTQTDIIYYTVTFVIEGEASFESVSFTVAEGTVIPEAMIPAVPEGYQPWSFDFTAPITGNVTITAEKEVIVTVFNVYFMVEDKIIATFTSDAVTVPGNPVVEGKEFVGWAVGDDIVKDPAKYSFTEDTTFVAKFTQADAPAGPSFFETNTGKCVAVIIGVGIIALFYAVYTNMFGMKDFLTSFKVQRVKKE